MGKWYKSGERFGTLVKLHGESGVPGNVMEENAAGLRPAENIVENIRSDAGAEDFSQR